MDQQFYYESLRTQAILQAAKLFCINCATTQKLVAAKVRKITMPPFFPRKMAFKIRPSLRLPASSSSLKTDITSGIY
jgi:hypothetical protein